MNPDLPPRRIPCVAVTGSIAAGKSAFGRALAALGADVVDADDLVHDLQRPGAPMAAAVSEVFGSAFLAADGSVDRARLGAVVFADPAARARLDALARPLVQEALVRWRASTPPGSAPLRAALVPLLFEAGWQTCFDYTVCIVCPERVALARLRARGLSAAEARSRIAAQYPQETKMKRSDFIVHNDSDLPALAASAAALVRSVLEKANK